ncbi:hypothetical protein BDZ45DRAFT_752636 [Acephala macrosclerotiorum]|nr:hypothetical protein BDZ45DRAFT_752636 [Acephala macrosclerotiorum]
MTSLVDSNYTRTELLVELNRWNTQHSRNKIETKISERDKDIIAKHEEVLKELDKENHPVRRDAGRAKAYVEGMLRLTTRSQFDEFPWAAAEIELNALLNTIRKEALGDGRGSESRSGRSESSQPGSSGRRAGRIVLGNPNDTSSRGSASHQQSAVSPSSRLSSTRRTTTSSQEPRVSSQMNIPSKTIRDEKAKVAMEAALKAGKALHFEIRKHR